MELKMYRLIILVAVSVDYFSAIEATSLPTCGEVMPARPMMESPRQKIPDTPLDFTVTPISPSSVYVWWMVSPEDYNHTMTYIIQYYPITKRLSGQGEALQDFKNITIISTNSVRWESAVIDDLMKGTEYRFRMLAANHVGVSQPCDVVTVLTEIDPPPQVEDVTVLPVGFGDWEITWRVPSEYSWSDQIIGYQILLQTRPIDSDPPFPIIRHISHTTNYTLRGLSPSTLSTISVAAYNSAGLGPSTFPIPLNTPQLALPVAPIHLAVRTLSSKALQVSWEIPFEKDQKIRNSTIEYYSAGGDLYREWPSFLADQLTVAHFSGLSHETTNITGLQPGTLYQFRVFVTNDAGRSPPSKMMKALTETPPNEPPQNIQISPAGFGELKITWDPLPEGMGFDEIRGYRIVWKKVTSDSFSRDDHIETSNRGEYILAGLESSTTYEISIAAYNDAGLGSFSFPTFQTTRKSEGSKNPLSIVVQPPQAFNIGDLVQLQCTLDTTKIKSTDPIELTWELYQDDGQPLRLVDDKSLPIYVTPVAENVSMLTITNFQLSDARDYICSARLSEEELYIKAVQLLLPL